MAFISKEEGACTDVSLVFFGAIWYFLLSYLTKRDAKHWNIFLKAFLITIKYIWKNCTNIILRPMTPHQEESFSKISANF